MSDALTAITAAEAKSAGERAKNAGEDQRAVALVTMQAAREGFMAPTEGIAFAAALGALWELYPDDERLRQETKAIGDRNKVIGALTNGVPVDFDALDLTPMPEPALGIIDLWRESDPDAEA